jgi:PAT family beta-lactamase induction signal transducer AmpG
LKYFLFGSLYFSEGLLLALSTVILIIYFTHEGISIATATLVGGIVYIPWILKFIFGPITDYFIKYGRKPFIIIGGILGAIFIFPLAIIDPKVALIPFTLLLFVSHIFIVFLDVSVDAWAIQTSKAHERGKVNAAMYGGLFGGSAFGSSVFAIIASAVGFNMVFITAALIILLTIIFPLLVTEKKIVKERQKIASLVITEFKKKNTLLVALFGFIVAMNFGMLIFIIPEYMMNVLKLDIAQTGIIISAFPIATVIGAFAGGVIVDKWGRKKIMCILLPILLISSALLTIADTWQILAIIYSMIGFLTGAALFAATVALFMDITNPKIAATQYSILTSISNFGDIGIATISGTLVLMLGYTRFFLYAAWIIGPALLVLYFVKEKQVMKNKGNI